jgi:glutamine amidotransferase
MDTIITKPESSLLNQSLNSTMSYKQDGSLLATNGDGFGVGWYGEKPEPGLFKDSEPAWANDNIHELCSQIKARIFMAHIRAASTGSVQRSNAHPFKYKNWLFQHNGFVNNFDLIRRDLHELLSDEQYKLLNGTTDSETIFRLALTFDLIKDPKKAVEKTIKTLKKTCKKHKIKPEFTLSCAISDGDSIYTIRYSTMKRPNSQFYSTEEKCLEEIGDNKSPVPVRSVVVVSEPIDHRSKLWKEMPNNSFAIIKNGKIDIEKIKVD